MIYQDFINIIKNLPFTNFDLLSVGITVAAIGILGFIIYINNKSNATNRAFLFLSVSSGFWVIINYLSYQINTSDSIILLMNRLLLFSAIWFAFSIFTLMYVFLDDNIIFSKKYTFLLLPLIVIVSILTLTPFVLSGVDIFTPAGQVATLIIFLPGMVIFGLTVLFLDIGGIVLLHSKIKKSSGTIKSQIRLVLVGLYLMLGLIIPFNFILPVVFNIVKFIPLGALFVFLFAVFTAYSIYKHHLFSLRAAAIAALTFILCVGVFLEVLFSNDIIIRIFRSSVFLLVLWVSILMNRFVETIAEQREDLQKANEGQENLIHIMNHQIKGYLGKNRDIFAELLSGDYGLIPDTAKSLIGEGLNQSAQGVDYVQDILRGASAQKGTLPYDMKPIDIKSLISNLLIQQKSIAEKKGLSFESSIIDGNYNMIGDISQLSEAFKNLITNAIKYNSQHGSIEVSLISNNKKIFFSVKDTGVGILDDDKSKIFTAGGIGKNSIKINTDAAGFGLAFVKGVVEAHRGIVGFRANTPEKGTTFFIELPVT